MARVQLTPEQEQQILDDLQKKADELSLKPPSNKFVIITFAVITVAFAIAMVIASAW